MNEDTKSFCAWKDCLVDGDERSAAQSRWSRWRAVAASIGLQSAAGAALALIPLLATGTLPHRKWEPPILVSRGALPGEHKPSGARRGGPPPNLHLTAPTHGIVAPPRIPRGVAQIDDRSAADSAKDFPSGCTGCDPNAPDSTFPLPKANDWRGRGPEPPPATNAKRAIISRMEPGALIYRVQPKYPVLAVQAHREGVVELRAIIGTDGAIHSLEVLSGHALFVQATLEAVREWRYRPTILNGEAVEVETRIRVTFTLGR